MSDLNIPGVSNKYGTQKMIDDLMKVERVKLTRMESTKKDFQENKQIWQDLNRHMQGVRDSSRLLYGFNNPFGNKLGTSSDESVLTAVATRAASNGDYKVKVLQVAQSDKFLSKSLALDTTIPAGEYDFSVGDKNIKINFKGGKLQNFADAINTKAPNLIKATVVKDTATTQVLQIEAIPVGQKNPLKFEGLAKDQMVALGIIGNADNTDKNLITSPETLAPQSNKSWPAPSSLPADGILEINYVLNRNTKPEETSKKPPGLSIPDGGNVTFKDITLSNSPMKVEIAPPVAPPPPAVVEDSQVFGLTVQGNQVPLPPISDQPEGGTLTFPLSSLKGPLEAVNGNNKNTGKSVEIKSIKVTVPGVQGNWKPLNPISRAQDTQLEFEGIKIVRDTNSVSDVIAGVTLNLLKPSDKTIDVKIDPDKKSIKDGIINYLVNYNRLLTDINVLVAMPSDDPANSTVMQEATYYSDEEKKTAEKRVGKFQGDLSLNQIKNMLQRDMMNPYGAAGKTPFTLLSDVGISTNSSGTAGDRINSSKLRGYLELDEPKLDSALTKDIEAVKNLFGNDTNGDLIVDNGAAWMIDETLKPYTQLGGFNAMKMSSLDSQIKQKDKEMTDYKDYLARYEQNLKEKYGNMESNLSAMQKSFDQIDNFNRENR